MPTPIALHDAIDQILDAIKARLEAAQPDGEALEAVTTILVGDRARTGFEMPLIWVLPEEALIIERHALVETWEMPVSLASVVQSDDPEVAYRLAGSLAVNARSAVAYGSDRRLGLTFVADVQSARFLPTRETAIDNRRTFSAAATVTVRFHVFEQTGG